MQDVLRRILDALTKAQIPYMFTGSFASSYHGTPRATQDLDIVISPTPEQLRVFSAALPQSEYYFDLEDALDALAHRKQFNVLDLISGWKVDFIIQKTRPFSHAEFDRRFQIEIEGMTIFLTSLEDIVLAKLEWAKPGQSERQIEDVAWILRSRMDELDRSYIDHWVEELGVHAEWNMATEKARLLS